MSCTANCGSHGEYRNLCNYDGFNMCDGPPLGKMSYACDPGLGDCHKLNATPNHAAGRYTTYSECAQNCGTHVGKLSFACDSSYGCHSMDMPPDPSQGRYTTQNECIQNCGGVSRHSFDCESLGSAGSRNHVCVMKHGGGGRYPTREACLQAGCQGQN